ncbi:MAG: hypothetical protein Q8P04_01920, partial [bacterium]|nr:hypothetical protein [bacterium]
AAKRKQGKKKAEAKPSFSRSWKPRRRNQPRSKSGPPSRQPELTEEMIERMQSLYGEMGSIRRVARHCYAEFGFSSPERLRDALSKLKQERGVILGIPRNRRRLSEETIEEAKRLYKEERMSIREISKIYHASWGYSFNGLRNTLYGVFKDHGVPLRKGSRRISGRPSKMTPRRTEVAWQLYSVGNYSLREIGEICYELWGYKPASCRNSISEALKRAGHKLRASKWEQGPRGIEWEVAVRMIKDAG